MLWRTWAVTIAGLSLLACGPQNENEIEVADYQEVASTSQALVVDDIYTKLKQAESLMPPPPPLVTLQVGTLNCASGQWSGLSSTVTINPITHKPMVLPAFASVNGLRIKLRFDVVNRGSSQATVQVGSLYASAPYGQSFVELDVGTLAATPFELNCGPYTRSDDLRITRTAEGAGAFTIAALPVAIVYEPPQNAAKTNKASITFGEQMSVVETVSSGQSTDQTIRQGWMGLGTWGNIIKGVANTNATAKSLLTSAFTLVGSVEQSRLQGTSVNNDSTLGLSTATAQTITTNAGIGPGQGDVFVIYRNARVVWALKNGEVTLSLLDKGTLVLVTGKTLQTDLAGLQAGTLTPSSTVSKLDATTITGLLALDPFTAPQRWWLGPTFPTPRFASETGLFVGPSTAFNASLSHVVTQSDKTSRTSYTGSFTDSHAGWLSVIGVGNSFDGTTKSVTTMGSSRTVTQQSSVSAGYNITAAANESFDLNVKYDSVFRTFALAKKTNIVLPPIEVLPLEPAR